MIRIDAWLYDFRRMAGYFRPLHDVQVYNGIDELFLIEVDGRITGQTIDKWQQHELVDEDKVNKAYLKWLDDQIDDIIL